jgi:riboflavin kinase/FMN adenylyltransferase
MACRRLTGSRKLPDELRGGVVAIGNFDGVHRGHQAVLERALERAFELKVPALVLTFEPHPRVVFRPDVPVARITPAPMRAKLIGLIGFDAVVEQQFDRTFASQTAEEFIDAVLLRCLGISHAVTGFDFHFGRKREGGPAYLMQAGSRLGFGVTLVDAFRDEGADIVSSSAIRGLLAAGDVAQVAGLLGYRYTVEAEIIHGKKLGRTLGYPTANMALPDETPLRHGIYAVRLRRPNGDMHDGVASFGRRPTVADDGAALLETFVFDFSADIYGEVCAVSFFGFLRGEEKFDGLDALMVQMRRDEEEARALLSGVTPLSVLDSKVAFA